MYTNFGMLTVVSILVGLERGRRREAGKETKKTPPPTIPKNVLNIQILELSLSPKAWNVEH